MDYNLLIRMIADKKEEILRQALKEHGLENISLYDAQQRMEKVVEFDNTEIYYIDTRELARFEAPKIIPGEDKTHRCVMRYSVSGSTEVWSDQKDQLTKGENNA